MTYSKNITTIFLNYNRDLLRTYRRYNRYNRNEVTYVIKYLRQQLKDLDLFDYIKIYRKKKLVRVINLSEGTAEIKAEWQFKWYLVDNISEDFILSLLRLKNIITS